jgi:hypothetical protein
MKMEINKLRLTDTQDDQDMLSNIPGIKAVGFMIARGTVNEIQI